jgi:NTP pyrophosphatase (non-canonical NTP hydrolase)
MQSDQVFKGLELGMVYMRHMLKEYEMLYKYTPYRYAQLKSDIQALEDVISNCRSNTPTFQDLQELVEQWSKDRQIIPNSTPFAQWKKANEELNELGDALVERNMDSIKDGMGDTLVCLINICALADISLVDCLRLAYNEIKDRKGTMNEEGIFVKETT